VYTAEQLRDKINHFNHSVLHLCVSCLQNVGAPLAPEVLAQVNQEGGGENERGRARSPLPAETVAYVVGDCDAKLVIGDDARLGLAPDNVPKISYDSGFSAFLDEGPFTPLKMQPAEPAMYLSTRLSRFSIALSRALRRRLLCTFALAITKGGPE
jgi:hypothetical protein